MQKHHPHCLHVAEKSSISHGRLVMDAPALFSSIVALALSPGGLFDAVTLLPAKTRDKYFSLNFSNSSQKFGTKRVPITAFTAMP